VPRFAFGGVAEIKVPDSSEFLVGVTSEIGLFGCFVRTNATIAPATKIDIRISHDDREFCTLATVAYHIPDRGIGIAFHSVAAQADNVLTDWLKQFST
jgi:hypothetical protein